LHGFRAVEGGRHNSLLVILFPEIFSKYGKNLIKNHAIMAQMMSEL
jgi:hypothetical protein